MLAVRDSRATKLRERLVRGGLVPALLAAAACAGGVSAGSSFPAEHRSPPKGPGGASRSAPSERFHRALHERYSHEDVLALLRADDAVVPNAPPVHPVHTMYNREAIVPPMCYTRTEGKHNPCYVCHQDRIPGRPNAMDDGDLQAAYSFSPLGA
jgi:hypothetical protein